MLLLTAPICHAMAFNLHHSVKEQADDKEVKKFEAIAHSAHTSSSSDLEKQLQEARKLSVGLRNHKIAYRKSGNPNQAARTEKRIARLNAAVITIQRTLEQIKKSTKNSKVETK
jgi:ribosomal protein L29